MNCKLFVVEYIVIEFYDAYLFVNNFHIFIPFCCAQINRQKFKRSEKICGQIIANTRKSLHYMYYSIQRNIRPKKVLENWFCYKKQKAKERGREGEWERSHRQSNEQTNKKSCTVAVPVIWSLFS